MSPLYTQTADPVHRRNSRTHNNHPANICISDLHGGTAQYNSGMTSRRAGLSNILDVLTHRKRLKKQKKSKPENIKKPRDLHNQSDLTPYVTLLTLQDGIFCTELPVTVVPKGDTEITRLAYHVMFSVKPLRPGAMDTPSLFELEPHQSAPVTFRGYLKLPVYINCHLVDIELVSASNVFRIRALIINSVPRVLISSPVSGNAAMSYYAHASRQPKASMIRRRSRLFRIFTEDLRSSFDDSDDVVSTPSRSSSASSLPECDVIKRRTCSRVSSESSLTDWSDAFELTVAPSDEHPERPRWDLMEEEDSS